MVLKKAKLGSSIKISPQPGATPDVYTYFYNGKYIDLQYIYGEDPVSKMLGIIDKGRVVDYKIISYGSQKHTD